jgi:3-deoxy-D-manno-octulosonic-acid transferase
MKFSQKPSIFNLHPSFLLPYLLNVVYLALIVLALPWLLYQRLRNGKYREGFSAKLWGRLPQRPGNAPCLWLHAVSVGEVNLLAPLLERWDRLHPDWDCIISTTTKAGYDLARKRYSPRTVVYCPLDFTWAVRRAMRAVRPTLFVLTELELWPNLIAAAKRHGAKVAVINGRLGERSFRSYRRVGWLVQRILTQLDLVAAQNQEYAERFLALGARHETIQVTGSIKFDGARTSRDSDQTRRLARLAGIADDDIVFLAGSTQDPEESLALSVFERLSPEFPRLRLILVPRHPERFDEVATLLDRRGLAWQRRSRLDASSQNKTATRILLVDAVGELGYWWGTAKIAFVGGSLTSRGGQNMIEPAGYGAAMSFGPNTWNFRDVVSLFLNNEAAIVVRDQGELEAFVRRCLTNPTFADEIGRRAQELVLQQQGAADETIALLDRLLPPDGAIRRDTLHPAPHAPAARSNALVSRTRS